MISPRTKALRLSVAVAFLTLGSSVAIAQLSESPQQADNAFKGIHRNLAISGSPETVTITDGKTYTRVTEQEYRERGYAPEFKNLPALIIKRLPVRVPVPPDNRD